MTCNQINKFTIIYYSPGIKLRKLENLILEKLEKRLDRYEVRTQVRGYRYEVRMRTVFQIETGISIGNACFK